MIISDKSIDKELINLIGEKPLNITEKTKEEIANYLFDAQPDPEALIRLYKAIKYYFDHRRYLRQCHWNESKGAKPCENTIKHCSDCPYYYSEDDMCW